MNRRLLLFCVLFASNLPLSAGYTFKNIGLERVKSYMALTDESDAQENAERSMVYGLFDKVGDQETNVVDNNLEKDLELITGRTAPEKNLFNRINKCTTLFGEAMFAHALLNPHSSLDTLKQRHAAVQELVNNPKLFAAIEQEVAAIKAVQSTILSYWPPSNHQDHGTVYYTVPFRSRLKILNRLNTKLNTCAPILEISNIKQTIVTASQLMPVLFATVVDDLIQSGSFRPKQLPHLMSKTALDYFNPFDPRYTLQAISDFKSADSAFDPTTLRVEICSKYLASLATTGLAAWGLYTSINSLIDRRKLTHRLHNQVMSISQLVQSTDTLKEQLQGTAVGSAVSQRMNTVYHEDNLQFTSLCGKLRRLKGSLSKLSHNGYGLAAHRLVESQQDSFIEMLMLLGELDAYLAAARLVLSEEGKGYCLVTYLSEATQPVVDISKFWNPFLDPNTAVANSVAIGTLDGSRNMLLTGPNAGGKSTVLKSITLSLLLAQSYGIAPAQSMSLTPFTKICSSLSIADDLARGTSLFKAEVLRAKHIKNTITACEPHEFVFTVIDELFSGTSAANGELAAYTFLKFLAEIKNSTCLFATHYTEVTSLAESHACINMRVGTPTKVNGKLKYPFTLEPGIADKNVAEDILREEGVFA